MSTICGQDQEADIRDAVPIKNFFPQLMLLFWLGGCGSGAPGPAFYYEASFDPLLTDRVQDIFREVSTQRQLEINDKSHEQGQDTLFISLHLDNASVLLISNVGVEDLVFLALYDYGKLSLEQLESLGDEARERLDTELGLYLVATEPR